MKKRLTALAAIGAAATTSLYTYARYIETNLLDVAAVDIEVANLPAALDGMRLVQLSDFHAGPTNWTVFERAVQTVNKLDADVLLFTGDFVDHYARHVFRLCELLAQMESTYGQYAVLGNHDIAARFPLQRTMVMHGLAHYGIRVLINSHVRLPNGLVLAGIDDVKRGKPNLTAALNGVERHDPVVLLSHSPDIADVYQHDGRIDLMLSGHTHGGQIRPIPNRAFILPSEGKKYPFGHYQLDDMQLYVNRGIGVAGALPLRYNCPPEITLLTLRAPTSA